MQDFLKQILESIQANTFVRITLSVPQKRNSEIRKVIIRLVELKKKLVLNVSLRYDTKDITRNYPVEEGIKLISEMIQYDFLNSVLFTIENDIVLGNRSGQFLMKVLPPTFSHIPDRSHDKEKRRTVSGKNNKYFHLLGLADIEGRILPSGQDKFKQIHQYIEILSNNLKTNFSGKKIKVADMGSGKGYLTFALYDYLTETLGADVSMFGVELRKELVDLCNQIAKRTGFSGLSFIESDIQQFSFDHVDVLVALHACDTATDQAIAKGILTDATMIVTAPCCHRQIRREIEKNKMKTVLDVILQHGIFMERQAEMITDAIRALILEWFGYRVKIVEFIADAHTHKNIMIIAVKDENQKNQKNEILNKIKHLKDLFGIEFHELEKLTGV